MKTKFILIIGLFFLSINVKAQWEKLQGPNYEKPDIFVKTDSVLYCGAWYGYYISYNDGQDWIRKNNGLNQSPRVSAILVQPNYIIIGTATDGIYKSTDNGNTWTHSNTGIIDTEAAILDIFYNNDTIFVASNFRLYYSINEGGSWDYIDNGLPYSNLSKIIKFNQDLYLSTMSDGIYKSIDGGMSWNKINTFPGTYYCDIYSNGTTLVTLSDSTDLYKSDDGITWQQIDVGNFSSGFNKIAFYDSTIYVGTWYRGIYRSNDLGNTWIDISNNINKGYVISIYADNDAIYVGTLPNIYRSLDNGNTWKTINNGLEDATAFDINVIDTTLFCLVENTGPTVSGLDGYDCQTISGGIDSLYNQWFSDMLVIGDTIISIHDKGVLFSPNLGQTWELRNNGLCNNRYSEITNIGDTLFLAIDTCGIYKSTDYGLNWVPINDGIPFSVIRANKIRSNETTLFIEIYTTTNSLTYKSDDFGNTWEQTSDSTWSDMAICDSVIMLTNSDSGVKISSDNGNTWNIYSAGLPLLIGTQLYDNYQVATNGIDFFLGTQHYGMYKLIDSIWVPINQGLTEIVNDHRMIKSIYIDDNYVYIAAEYHSIWKRSLKDISSNKFTGNVYNDVNNNGQQDSGELGIPNVIVYTKTSGGYYTTDSLGNFTAYSSSTNDTLMVNNYSIYASSTPECYYVSQADTGLNFGLHFFPNVKELGVYLTAQALTNSNVDNYISLSYFNSGTIAMDAEVKLILDSNLEYQYSDPPADTTIGDTVIWNFNNLPVGFGDEIIIITHIPLYVDLGDSLISEAYIYPVSGDTIPVNNYSCLTQVSIGSCDPNYKEVTPCYGLTPNQLNNNERLIYTVHFQNTGTDYAYNISIIDTLSQNLNILSFNVISASHPYSYSIYDEGVVEFKFDNIMLPDSNNNEPESHGNIIYSIKALSSLVLDDSITNTAYIYFDNNEAVITNTTISKIYNPYSFIQNISNSNGFVNIYPNPTNDKFIIVGKDIKNISVYSELGSLVLQQKTSKNVNLSDYPDGIYFIKISIGDIIITKKLIKL